MTKPSWQDFGAHDESACPELWDGVIGAWAPCLGPTGSRLHDMSRRSNWGTLTNMDNATDWVVSGGQYALDLDGSNDRINVGDITLPSAKAFSLWLRLRAFNAVLLSVSRSGAPAGYFAYVEASNIYNRNGGTVSSASLSLSLNVWVHLVLSSDGSTYTVYVDGAQRATMQDAGATLLRDVGAYDDGAFALNGQIDDTTVWGRALSANEVRQLYQLGRGGMYQRRRRRAIYLPQTGFQSAWAVRRSQIIGGGLR